jgi:hypothetical protein
VINPVRFTVDVARAAWALPALILRLPKVVDDLDRLAWDLVPKLRDSAEVAARMVPPGTRRPAGKPAPPP